MEEQTFSGISRRRASQISDVVSEYQAGPSDEVEEEISPLQYARTNGLSRNYLADSSAWTDLKKLQVSDSKLLIDDTQLPQFNFGPGLRVEERFNVSREAAMLIALTAKEEYSQDIADLTTSLIASERSTKKLKLELPLLRSDNEIDCKSFARREGFEIKIQDVRLPLELVNEENGEGLTWPARFRDLNSKTLEDLKKERLSVSKDTMVYLVEIMEPKWSAEQYQVLWESQQTHKKNRVLEPVSPPLTPSLSPYRPFEPSLSDPASQIPIFSDPASPTKMELDAVEKKIFEQDIPTPLRGLQQAHLDNISSETYPSDGYIKLGDIYSPLASIDGMQSPPSVGMQMMKREDLKVEETLTPDGPELFLPKFVRFSDVIEEMELDLNITSTMNSPTFESKFFEEAFGSALEQATRQSEQERLLEADTTARVDVPVMDFSKPDPPWIKFEQISDHNAKVELQKFIMRNVLGTEHKKWLRSNKVADRLVWNPFPRNLAEVALEEDYQLDDSTWNAFVPDALEGNVLNSSSVVWKPEGLRILREEENAVDDDDEIEVGQFRKGSPQDFNSLIKKRKMELEGTGQWRGGMTSEEANIGTHQVNAPQNKSNSNLTELTKGKALLNNSNGSFGILGGAAFSAIDSLDNYLELRGTKKLRLSESVFFTKASTLPLEVQVQRDSMKSPQLQLPIRASPLARLASLPTPRVDLNLPVTNIIVSSTLLKHRKLVKCLEKQFPGLTLVERDFSSYNTTMWMPGSVTRSPITSPLASEADLILCPSTGVIITTLPKIKQRPLPGQKAKAAIRERLEQVAARYERLVVFVSEDRADETSNGIDEFDCCAYVEFTAFTLSLEASISVHFVGGGEETLSKWLVSVIAQNRIAGSLELLQEETHWELFLRRAGMNAFAAQAVIAEVKSPEGVDPHSPSKKGIFGLSAFVEMGKEERLRRFSSTCGKRMVERVSAVIDAKWAI